MRGERLRNVVLQARPDPDHRDQSAERGHAFIMVSSFWRLSFKGPRSGSYDPWLTLALRYSQDVARGAGLIMDHCTRADGKVRGANPAWGNGNLIVDIRRNP